MAPVSRLEIDIRQKRFLPVGQARAHTALENLSVTVPEQQFLCVSGPSGCGKTTLLNCIAGLDRDFEGRIALSPVAGREHPVIGYVFQNPRLLPWRTVIENIELVLPDHQGHADTVDKLLEAMGLAEFRHTFPGRLSLGMERRVALARAFAVQPDVLLMDEPFVSLDEPTAQRLRRLLVRTWQERPTTVVFVTHDLREAIQLADRILLLSPPPGTVMADIPVTLVRAERSDRAAIEVFRTRLFREFPSLNGDL